MQNAIKDIDHDAPTQQSLDVEFVEDMLFKLRRDGDLEEEEWQELQHRIDSLSMLNGFHTVLAVRATRAIENRQRTLRQRVRKTTAAKALHGEEMTVQTGKTEMAPELVGAA